MCSLLTHKTHTQQGFDEFMNIVLDDAEEILMKKDQQRKKIGKIMLKGDNISLIKEV